MLLVKESPDPRKGSEVNSLDAADGVAWTDSSKAR